MRFGFRISKNAENPDGEVSRIAGDVGIIYDLNDLRKASMFVDMLFFLMV